MNFKREELYTIATFTFVEEEGIKGVAFLAADHNFYLACVFGPIGAQANSGWKVTPGALNAFYGSAGVGINSLGYFGCIPKH